MHIVSFGARVAPRDRIWCLHGIQTSNRAQKGVLQQRLGSACASLFFFSVHALFQVFRQLMARKTEFLQAVWAAIGSNILLFWFAAGGRSDTVQETKRCHPAEYRTCNNRWNKMHLCPLVQQFALSWFNLRGACKDDGATVCNDIILVFGYIGSSGNVDWPVVPQWVFSIPELQCFSTFSSSWTYTYIYIYFTLYIYICIHEYTHIHMFLDALQIGRNLRWTRKRTRCSNVSRLRNWTSPMSLGNHKIQCGKHGYTVCERVLSDFNHWSTIYFRVWGLCNPMV